MRGRDISLDRGQFVPEYGDLQLFEVKHKSLRKNGLSVFPGGLISESVLILKSA
jgi:hypothetical protein